MQLLVSVRHPEEVEAALQGGADIVDVKDPARGPLAPVAPDCLAAIERRVPDDVPLSIALGDAASEDVAAGIEGVRLRPRGAPVYLKLGVSSASPRALAQLLARAVEAAGNHPAGPRLIVVEYADSSPQRPGCRQVLEAAAEAGATGLLVDTATKDGRTLFAWWSESTVAGWIAAVRRSGLSVGVAGSLGAAEVARVAALGPDVVGVRGAACHGGRLGSVQASRVRSLRAALAGDPRATANRQSLDQGRVVRSILK